MTPEELHRLLESEAQAFMLLHSSDDPARFAMRFHGARELPIRAIAEQLACQRKAAKKLPLLSRHHLLYTPLALEQASGERAAAYKASFIFGKRLIDLSGGLGVDTMLLAKGFESVVYCERDPLLCDLMAHNLKASGTHNVAIEQGDSMELLAAYPPDSFEWIYVDPARREEGRRSIALEAASPDVVAAHDFLLRCAPKVCIKASPALEISGLKALLPSLRSIIVLSVDRECKEVLLQLERAYPADGAVQVKAVSVKSDSEEVKEVIGCDGDDGAERVVAIAVKEYLYEPDPAIIKARVSAVLARDCGLEFVNQSVDYLTSDKKVEDFPGKTFQVIACAAYKPKSFRAFLQRHAIAGASIQRRDFPLSADELRRKYKLRESESAFLFFTRDAAQSPICIYALRVFPAGEAAPAGQGRSAAPEC